MKRSLLIVSCLLMFAFPIMAASPDISHPVMRELFEPIREALMTLTPDEQGVRSIINEGAMLVALFDPSYNYVLIQEGANVAIYWVYSGQVEVYEFTGFGWMPVDLKDIPNFEDIIKEIYNKLFVTGVPI